MADELKKTSAETPAEKKADKKKADSKKTNKANAPKEKKGNIFARMGRAIKKFFKDVKGECKKVVWPDSKTVLKSTGIVLLTVIIVGAVIGLIDLGLSRAVGAIVDAAKNANAAETTTAVTGAISGFLGL